MSTDPLIAEAEADWTMAYAQEEGIRALVDVSPPGVVRLAWLLGHNRGRRRGMVEAQIKYAEAMSKHDEQEGRRT